MDPLAQLEAIQLPEQIHHYPVAIGWWILLLAVVAITVLSVYLFIKKQKLNKVKKSALKQLQQENTVAENIALIKTTAMYYFSRQEIAPLSGQSLQAYLIKKLPSKHQANFISLSQETWLSVYSPTVENAPNEEFQQAVTLWINKALPPKKGGHA